MPSVTRITTEERWGSSSFNSSTSNFHVGRTSTTYYHGFAKFAEIPKTWTITKITFKMNRTDSYSSKVLQFGTNQSSSWDSKGVVAWHADFTVSSGTGAKSWDLTAYKDIIQGYVGNWYMQVTHGSGTNSYCEFTGGSGSSAPRLVIEYLDSSLTVPAEGFVVGTPANIVVGNAGSGLTHKVSYTIGSANGTLASGAFINAGDTVSWTPPATLANQILDDTVGDISFSLENYLSGVLQSTTALTYSLTVPNVAPYLPSITSAPPTHVPIGASLGVYVQNQSKVQCTVTAVTAYGAPITQYQMTVGGVTYSSATNVILSGALSVFGALSITITITDSRGRSVSTTYTSAITVYEWFTPLFTSASVYRCLADGTPSNAGKNIKYVVDVKFAPVNNLNVRAGTVNYKIEGGSYLATPLAMTSITAYSMTVSGIVGSDAISASAYTVELAIVDKYATTTIDISLASSKIWFDLHSSGEGMAIGKPATVQSLFDVGIESNFDKGVSVRGPLRLYPDGKRMAVMETDCFANGCWPFAAGTPGGGSVDNSPGEPNHPGVLVLSSATSNPSGYCYYVYEDSLLLAGGETFHAIFNPVNVSNLRLRIGFCDAMASASASVVDCCMLSVTSGGGCVGKCMSNSAYTDTSDSITLVNGTWYHGIIEVVSPILARFTIKNEAGQVLWTNTVTTNIPTAAGRVLGAGFSAMKTSTTSGQLVKLDYLSFIIDRDLVR